MPTVFPRKMELSFTLNTKKKPDNSEKFILSKKTCKHGSLNFMLVDYHNEANSNKLHKSLISELPIELNRLLSNFQSLRYFSMEE